MGNICCRNAIYTPTAYFYSARVKKTAPQPPSKAAGSHAHGTSVSTEVAPVMAAYHAGDDCAINELLEGRMDLNVILPDRRVVRMTVERRTPMMDLLVQATTANKISPGGHVIHIWADRGKDFIPYKPSTPIGSLDTNTIYIVPKSAVIDPPVKRLPKVANQPFEQTFRLQVNLPRNQLMVLRVSPRMPLSEVKHMACSEKGLDPSRYQLVSPNQPSQVVDLSKTLAEYGATEISLLSISCIQANICSTATDLIAYASREDSRKKKAILGLLAKNKKGSSGGSSDDLNDRSSSPCRSDGSGNLGTLPTKVPGKKRPAPPPPPPCKPKQKASVADDAATTVSHSRHSSDSSGYHEPSLFSDSPDSGSPETSSGSGSSAISSLVCHHYQAEAKAALRQAEERSREKPIPNIITKKRRAPPPPPVAPKGPTENVLRRSRSDSTGTTISADNVTKSRIPVTTSSDLLNGDLLALNNAGKTREEQEACKKDHEFQITFTQMAQQDESLQCQSTQNHLSSQVSSSSTSSLSLEDRGGDDTTPSHETESGEAVYLSDTDEPILSSFEHKRKESLSSLTTLDDIQMSFDQTIEAAKKALEMEEMQKNDLKNKEEEDSQNVTNAQMAALSARLDQDLTKQGILSQIEAAFYTLEEQARMDLHLAPSSGSRPIRDWDYPPSSFGSTKKDNSKCTTSSSDGRKSVVTISSTSDVPLVSRLSVPAEDLVDEVFEGDYAQSDTNSHVVEDTRKRRVERTNSLQGDDTTRSVHNRLQNFSIGFYTSHPKPEMYSSPANNVKATLESRRTSVSDDDQQLERTPPTSTSCHPNSHGKGQSRLVKSESFSDLSEANSPRKGKYGGPGFRIRSFLERNRRSIPNDNKVYGVEGSVRGIKGQVRLRRAELVDFSMTPLKGRSTSMLNLSPMTLSASDLPPKMSFEEKMATLPAERSGRLSRAHSDQNLVDPVSSVEKSDFVLEQERLQNEYTKLQKQFLVWQQQLINNQSVLQKKQIMPETSLPSPSVVADNASSDGQFARKNDSGDGNRGRQQYKMQNGPIPQSKSCPDHLPKKLTEVNRTSNITVAFQPNSQHAHNSQLSKHIPSGPSERKANYFKSTSSSVTSSSQVSKYEQSKNVSKSLDLGNGIIPNGMHETKGPDSKTSIDISLDDFSTGAPFRSNTLRSSNNKTQFKPPQVRSSSKTRQRLPPEVRSEQDLGVPQHRSRSADNDRVGKSGATTVNIFNRRDHSRDSKSSKDDDKTAKGVSCQWTVVKHAATNGHAGHTPRASKSCSAVMNGHRDSSHSSTGHPPPPPPQPVKATTTVSSRTGGVSAKHGKRRPVQEPVLDPREELMLEIRKFGGRHGLRKVSLDPPSWQVNLFGQPSMASA